MPRVSTNQVGKDLLTRVRANTKRRGGGGQQKVDAVGKYASDAWSLAKRTASGLNEIRKMINVEVKHLDITQTTATTRAGGVNYLTPLAQGTDDVNRIGNSVKMQSFELKGAVYVNGANAVVRILVVRDLQNRGADPSGADILAGVSSAVAPFSPVNFNNGPQLLARFSILWDSLLTVDMLQQPIVPFEVRFQHDGHVKFNGLTAASADAGAGAMYFVAFTDLAANQPNIPWQARLLFTDD
jgi:hypothetical protein